MALQEMATWTDEDGTEKPGRWFRKIDDKTGQPVTQLHTVNLGGNLHDAVKGYVDMYVVRDDTIKRLMGQGWMAIPDPRTGDPVPEVMVNTEPLDPEEEAARLEARLAEIHARNDAGRKEFNKPAANKPAKR
jgi:hypothetical protein